MSSFEPSPSLGDELNSITANIPEPIGSRIDAGVHEIELSGVAPGLSVGEPRRTSRCPMRWESRFRCRTCW